MGKQINNRMQGLKKVFFVLLILDFAELVLATIALYPTFKQMAGNGQLMFAVMCVISALIAAVLLFEILAKFFLLRSTSPTFSWSSGRKGYATAAKLLLLLNLAAVFVSVLSLGGEGATLINQMRLCLQMVASTAEIIVVVCYLRKIKRILKSIKEEN